MERLSINSLEFVHMSFAHETDRSLFEDLNFKFPMGQNCRFQLEAGTGSSTLLQIMAGLKTGLGAYEINGQNIFELSFEEFLSLRLNIGYSFDYHGLLANKTLRENLLLPLQYHQYKLGREGQEWVAELLEHMGIAGSSDKRPAMCTGGVRKVACVLRAMVMQPELVLFDDPTTGMNADQKVLFVDLVQKQQKLGHLKHCFFVSHDEALLSNFEHYELQVQRSGLVPNAPQGKVVNL